MIGVCGSGSWGTALASTLARNTSADVLVWGRELEVLDEFNAHHTNEGYLPGITLPKNVKGCKNVEEFVSKSQDILLVVPSNAFCDVLDVFKPLLTPKHRIVWATKGLEPSRGRFLDVVLREKLGDQQIYAVLAGPSFAKEVALALPTAVTVASNNEQFAKDLLTYFQSDTFRVYLSDDVIGAQVGGVIKNILAVAAGISDGLGYGANARAAIITRGIAEMMRFGKALGAKSETLQGLAGVGDVILTCTDDQSRNRRFGLAIAKGEKSKSAQSSIGQVVEAAHNAEEICKLATKHNIDMPIADQVHKILIEEISPQQAVMNLLSRKPTHEW